MHRDNYRNEISPALKERQAEFANLPGLSASELIITEDIIYQFITTGDGSPSLRLADAAQRPEAMHHSGGALAESIYIYGGALEVAIAGNFANSVASVGLGLGYNEWITLAIALKNNFSSIEIESFESNPLIRAVFEAFLNAKSIDGDLQNQLFKTFQIVVDQVAVSYGLSAATLFQFGQKMLFSSHWAVRERLDFSTPIVRNYSVIYYDAFSGKATPELWSEEFLTHFLKSAATPCILSTYASTAALKRALLAANFTKAPQTGFGGKRESTRAIRYGTV